MLRVLFQLFGDYYAQANLSGVEVIVRSILATVPGDMASMHFLGLVYYRTGRTDDAIQAFELAAPKTAAPASLEFPVGEDFLARNGYSAAAACHQEATRRSKGLALAWYDVGLTLAELGHPRRAVAAFRASLMARPEFPAATRAVESLTNRIVEHGALEGESLQLGSLPSVGKLPYCDLPMHRRYGTS